MKFGPLPFNSRGVVGAFGVFGMHGLAVLAACAPSLAGQVESFTPSDKSVFEQYAGRKCEVVAKEQNGNETRFERDCQLLENLAKGTAESCQSTPTRASAPPRPVSARFPGREDVVHLCGVNSPPLGLENETTIRFAVFGDFGVGEDEAKGHAQVSVARRLQSECAPKGNKGPCAFVITVGDNIYPDGVPDVFSSSFATFFEHVYKDLPKLPFFMVPGNHDYNGNVQAQVEYSHFSERWRMPDRNYSLEGLPPWLRIHMLDTSPLEETSANDEARLKETQEGLCGKPKAQWRFLVGHHPEEASGHHGPSERQRLFSRALAKTCPHVIRLSGHEHHQEHIYDASAGIHQWIQGGGGAFVKPFTPGLYEHNPSAKKVHFAATEHGFAIVEANPETLRFHYYGLSSKTPLWSCEMSSPEALPHCESRRYERSEECLAASKITSKTCAGTP